MTTRQPEALRLADELCEAIAEYPEPTALEAQAAAELRRLHAYCQELESQVILDCMTHVQNPAEIEHVAGDVSKNGAGLNMSTQRARITELESQLAQRFDAADMATAAQAVVPSGWNLVPTEPTQAMLDAVVTSMDDFLLGKEAEKQYREDWAAMLAAAPTSQADTQPAQVLWVSPEQFANFVDTDEAPFGKYIPARKTSAGKFTMPLFAARAPAPAQPAGMTDDEKHLRRMLCVAHAGALAYMDDGEASDSRMHPTIDFLRDSPKDIQRKIGERNRAAFTAAPAQPVAQQGVAYAALPESFLEIPDVQDESGINAYYSRDVVLGCIDAALASGGQAQATAQTDSVLYDPKAVLDVFNGARAGSEKPVGYMRGIRAVIAHWESRPEPHRWMVPARADSVREDAARLLALEAAANQIFNNPPSETSQDVRDVIEWFSGSIRVVLDAPRKQGANHD